MNIENDTDRQDLQLLSLLTAGMLRDRGSGQAPPLGAYVVHEDGRNPMGQRTLEVAVPLGRGIQVTVEAGWRSRDHRRTSDLVDIAGRVAGSVLDLQRVAEETGEMLREVRAAARGEVAKARRRGLPCTLVDISLTPVEAASRIEPAARVRVETLGQTLRTQVSAFDAECAGDVAEWFSDARERQKAFSRRREHLGALGAAGQIDPVVVNELRSKGADIGEVLSKLRSSEDWIVDLELPDGSRDTLYWKEGSVFSQVSLGEGASWNEGTLNLARSPRALTDALAGRRLAEVFAHPLLGQEDLVIRRCHGREGEWGAIHCTPSMLNFATEGARLWR